MADLVGAHVTLTGLVARADNGRRGVVLSYSAERGRVGVKIEGEPKPLSLKPSALAVVVPIRVGGALRGVKVVEVACGGEHTLARTATGHTYAWGSGQYGQLSLGRFVAMVTEPTLIESEMLDPGVAEVRRGVEAPADPPVTLDLAGSGLRRIVSTVRHVPSFILYAVFCFAVAVCLGWVSY